MSTPGVLANGTYTISSFMGNDTYYLNFLDGENGFPLRGRNYTGSDAFHWDIATTRIPLQYSIRNRLFQKDVAFTNPLQPYSILEAGDGPQSWWVTPIEDNMYMIAVAPEEGLVWNIAGAAPESSSDMILWPHEDGAPNEKWFIRPLDLEAEPQSSSSRATASATVAPATTQKTFRPSSTGVPGTSGSVPQVTQEAPSTIPQDEGGATGSVMKSRVIGALAMTTLVPLVLALVV